MVGDHFCSSIPDAHPAIASGLLEETKTRIKTIKEKRVRAEEKSAWILWKKKSRSSLPKLYVMFFVNFVLAASDAVSHRLLAASHA